MVKLMVDLRFKMGQLDARWPRRAVLAASLALSLAAADRAAAGALNVDWGSGCGATCFGAHGAYSLTFSASAFSGPVDVSKLLIDRRVLGTMDASYFNVSFTLGGQKIASWGNWNMGSVAGDQLTLSGSDLIWNPTDGDLVLVFQLVAPNGDVLGSDQGGGGFFGDGGGFSDVTTTPPDKGPGDGSGTELLTPPNLPTIEETPPSDSRAAVPEPSVWALAIAGFGLAGAALRRRRVTAA